MRTGKYAGKHAAPSSGALAAAVPASAALAAVVPAALGALTPVTPAVHAAARADLDARVVHQEPAARPLVTRVTSGAAGKSYTVAAGDTLSGIAGRACGSPGDWPAVWHANQAEIPDPGLIYPGQVLRFTCGELASQPTAPAPAVPSASQPQPAVQAPAAVVTGASGVYSCAALESLWERAGGSSAEAFMAAEVAMAESGGNPDDISSTSDYGLWQINKPAHPAQATLGPAANAAAAVSISSDGTNWTPWTTFQKGLYAGKC
jgi:hypothetical protein